MARHITLSARGGVCLTGVFCSSIFLLAGCQANSGVISTLPSPNFNGPIVLAPEPKPMPPVAVAPAPAKRNVPISRIAGEASWTPSAPARGWKWIVIHHSATPSGSAAVFDRMHKEKGWDELGYHFVVGNGTDSGNGQVEVGGRWSKQKWGAHAKTPDNQYNDYGVGICLVGNFDVERPTPQQLQAVAKLTSYLMRTYRVPASRVLGHRDTGKATDCPGSNLNIAQIRQMASQMLADAGERVDDDTTAAATPDHKPGELLAGFNGE